MFSSVPLTTTTSSSAEVPVRISFDPTPILREQSFNANHVSYDPETGILTYQQDRTLTRKVEFVFPATIEGYAVEVELERFGVIAPHAGNIVLPPLTLYAEHAAEVRFSATTPTDKPPRPKYKIEIRVRPTGGG